MNPYIDVAAILLALWAIYRSLKYEIPQSRKTNDADLAMKYDEIATRAAQRALDLDGKVSELSRKVDDLEKENLRLRCENEDLRDWADRLVHQISSLGAQPVKIRTKE